jgi:glycosyltransferase involved in cell wall biosynthesis
LHVALFLHDLRAGGAERVSVNLANAIKRKGHMVDLVLVNRQGCAAFFEDLDTSIRIFELPQSRTLASPVGFWSYIRRERPNLVISALTHINISSLIACRLIGRRPRLIIVEHGQFSREKAKPMAASVRCAYWLAPWLYPAADVIAAVSEGAKKDLAESTGIRSRRISVLHNPVVIEGSLEKSHEPVDHPWFREGEPPVVLAVGAMREEKNFPLLVRAFNKMRRQRKARLIIIGDGPEKLSIEHCVSSSQYSDDIALIGFQSNPLKFMRRAALLALSSDHEALPTVLIEAMSCGTPVVATDCPCGPSEILSGGKFGMLVNPGDASALAEAMAQALKEPVAKDLLIKRAGDFSSEVVTDRYLCKS